MVSYAVFARWMVLLHHQKKNKRSRRLSKSKASKINSNSYLDFVSIVDRYKDAVVNIEVTQAANSSTPRNLPFPFHLPMFNSPELQPRAMNIGTGFIFDKRGYILTNEHVIHGSSQVHVKLYGKDKVLPAQVVGTDYQHDLAVLKVTLPHEITVLKLGDSKEVKVGEWVIAIGKPIVPICHNEGDDIEVDMARNASYCHLA